MTLDAMGLRGLGGWDSRTAQKVHTMGDGFKVFVVAAMTNAAGVIRFFPFWNRSLEELMRDLMDPAHAFAVPKLTVSSDLVDVPLPEPAPCFRVDLDLLHETANQFFFARHLHTRVKLSKAQFTPHAVRLSTSELGFFSLALASQAETS
jgi:hypothetical protein